MGGLEHYRIEMDPAIQKLGTTMTNRHKYFRWTPRTARLSFMYLGVVPALLGFIAYQTDGKFEFRGKRKGDLVSEF